MIPDNVTPLPRTHALELDLDLKQEQEQSQSQRLDSGSSHPTDVQNLRAALRSALLDAIDNPPETGSEWGRFGKALKELVEIQTTPEQIRTRAQVYRTKYPGYDLTPTALTANWSSLREASPGGRRSVLDDMLAEEGDE